MADNSIHISSSPHFTFGNTTQKTMMAVIIAMIPEIIASTVFFGPRALAAVLISTAACVIFELLFQIVTRQKVTVSNLSACVTGILLALVCPSTVPFWQLVLGDAIAIIVAKGLFGGIGANVFNPALTGRAFLFISFPAAMGATWAAPKAADCISSATALSSLKGGTLDSTSFDFFQYFLGNRAGCIGETSVILLLISFLFLLAIRVIDFRAPLAMVLTVAAATFAKSIISTADFIAAAKDVAIALLTGGIIFGATFMVTDYATAPVTKGGRLVFGFGCGLITWLIRNFGGYPEGVMFSILIMNAVAPFLNNITSRKYGYGKKGNRKPVSAKIVQEFDVKNSKEETK